MDILCQLIVPKIRSLEELKIIDTYELDGVEYPIEPRTLSWRDLSFTFDEKNAYLKKYLPPDYLKEDWVWLKASDDTLDKYEIPLNTGDAAELENNLENFIRLFLGDYKAWVMTFVPHYDQIDKVYQLSVEDCISKLRANLNRSSMKEGFVAFK